MRGIACLGVIWGHSISENTVLRISGLPIYINGAFWVWIFFSISGYLIAKSFLQQHYSPSYKGYVKFLLNRALRILPLAYLALIIGLIASFIAGDVPSSVIKQFLFISHFNDMSLSGPLWSVATELHFYLFAFFLMPIIFFKARFLLLPLFLFAFLFSGWWAMKSGDMAIQPRTLFSNIGLFIFGFSVAFIKPLKFRYASIVKVALIFSFICIVWELQNLGYGGVLRKILDTHGVTGGFFWDWGFISNIASSFGIVLPMGIGSVVAMLIVLTLLGLDEKEGSSNLARCFSFFSWSGFYCYGIYVWHSILGKLNSIFFKISDEITLLAYLSISLAIAPISFKFFERYFLEFKF